MRKVSAPVLFLLGLLAVAAVGGATVGLAALVGLGDGLAVDDTGVVAGDGTTPTSTNEGGDVVLGPDQVQVTGVATNVDLEGIHLAALPVPLTVTTPERGLGAGARIEDVVVDGDHAQITWDAGRPLALGGDAGGALAVGLVNLYLGPGTAVVGFPERGVHGFAAGGYDLATPVAVARGAGLGESRESVRFDATDASTISFTGGASAAVALEERDLVGPGRIVLRGMLRVRHPDGTTTDVASVELPAGAFELHVVPLMGGGGWDVRALLQGAVVEG